MDKPTARSIINIDECIYKLRIYIANNDTPEDVRKIIENKINELTNTKIELYDTSR